jgi:hypothetical protein
MSTEIQVVKATDKAAIRQSMETFFAPFEEQANEWAAKAAAIEVNSADDVEGMKLAREARLALRDVRVGAKSKHDELKEASKIEGQVIDEIERRIRKLIEPIEELLEQKEKFVEIQEAKRKAELAKTRLEQLLPFMGVEAHKIQLGELDEMVFQNILQGQKLSKEQKDREAAEQKIKELQAEQERQQLRQKVEVLEKQNTNLQQKVVAGNPFTDGPKKKADKTLLREWAIFISQIADPPVNMSKPEIAAIVSDVRKLLIKVQGHINNKVEKL